MYLVGEDEFKQLKKRKLGKQPRDVQLVTDSLKAVTQKRKKEAISRALPRINLRKYTVQGGVTSMTDKDVVKPLRAAAAAAAAQPHDATPRPQAARHPPRAAPIQHSTPSRARDRSPQRLSFYGTPIANLSAMRRYPVQ